MASAGYGRRCATRRPARPRPLHGSASPSRAARSRVWRGPISEGTVLNGSRVAGVVHLLGGQHEKVAAAVAGEVVGLTRMEEVATGAVLTPSGKGAALPQPE